MSVPMETIINPKSKVQSPKSENQILAENGFFWRESGGVKVLVCRALEENGFTGGFSTRLGGVSPFPENDLNLGGFNEDSAENIFENRRRFLKVFEGNFKIATVWQVHGDNVKIVKTKEDIKDNDEKCDALVSDLKNVLLGVKTADCVPVLIGDAKTKAYAAVHAGWRGSVQSIAVRAIETMQSEFGSEPQDMIAAIGPCASGANYEIGQDVIDAFEKAFSTCGKYFTPTSEGHALIDLPLANKDQLLSCGIPLEKIFTAPFCTIARTDLFFSYRVEKRLHGKTGRLM